MRRRTITAWVALAGVLAAAGCWPQPGRGPEHQAWNPAEATLTAANVATLQPAWSVDVGRWAAEPVVQGGRAYVAHVQDTPAGAQAGVTAVDTASGAVSWVRAVGTPAGRGSATATGPVVAGGEVLVAWRSLTPDSADPACDAGMTHLDPATGAVRREATTFPAVLGAPVPFGDRYAATTLRPGATCYPDASTVAVRDAATDAVVWSGSPPAPLGNPVSDPAVIGDQLLVGSTTRLASYDAGGCGAAACGPDWVLDLPNTVGRPMAAGDQVFVDDVDDLVAVDRATGVVRWRGEIDTWGDNALATADGRVYVVDRDRLRVFDAAGCGAPTCPPLWTATLWAPPFVGSPNSLAVAGGVVYVGTSFLDRGALRAFPAAGCGAPTCGELWSTPVDGSVSAISVAEGHLLATVAAGPAGSGAAGRLLAFAPA